MAEEFAFHLVEELVPKLAALAIDEISLIRGAREEVKKLERILTDIKPLLQDAEEKQAKDEGVKSWLKDLKVAALDAEDVVEELACDALRRQVVGQRGGEIERKVRNFLSCFTTIPILRKTGRSVRDISKRFQEIDDRMKMFKLEQPTAAENAAAANTSNASHRETPPLVEESEVIGRVDDKNKIVDMLIHHVSVSGSNDPGSSSAITVTATANATTLSIVAIVGPGGLGKTTLAKLVFNDSRVEQHFGRFMIWICVSEDFAIKAVWLQILRKISSSSYSSESNMDELQDNLKKELNGNKFMLVLDDMWEKGLKNNDKWNDLILPLKRYGGAGSQVLVTTREDDVASTIGAQHKHCLHPLSDDQCWDLFQREAFRQGGPEKTDNLEIIGREIVKKCGGVTLAVKVLGKLMNEKTKEREWTAIRDRPIWEADKVVQDQVMEILKLSYNNLSPQVRQCFSYCSIFPKDYKIRKLHVIQLWMAQGFLQTVDENELMEDLGEQYIRILCRRSLFEGDADELTFHMHDLMHDLAMMIRGFECSGAGHANNVGKPNEDLRHFSYLPDDGVRVKIPKVTENAKLRTLHLAHKDHEEKYSYYFHCLKGIGIPKLLQLTLLRVLDLSHTDLEKVPSSIDRLRHLKYLNLSYSGWGWIQCSRKEVINAYHTGLY